MKKFRFFVAFYFAKLSQIGMKILKRNATYFPGKMAIKICPDFLGYIDKPDKIIAVTGTNGKTTVCNMINDILIDNGYDVLNNRLGSNLNSGIASALIGSNSWKNKNKKEIAVFEIDERSSKLIYKYITPTYLVCTNIFRDSIKRNANVDYIVDIINSALPKKTKLIVDADDLVSCSLGKENKKIYYGIGKIDTDVEETNNIIKDIRTCPMCDAKLKYEYARYHHIGKAFCPKCNFKSPESDYFVEKIDKENSNIVIVNNDEKFSYYIVSNSIFNVYNELAVIAVLREIGLEEEKINATLKKTKIVETRINTENIGNIRVITHLSKGQNPVAASRVFDYVKSETGNKAVILIIDDCDDAKYSSENLTWLYDADFELLNDDSIKQVIVGGVRANDYYLRLLVSGIERAKLAKIEDELETIDFVDKNNIDTVFILHDIYKYDVALKLKEKLRENI